MTHPSFKPSSDLPPRSETPDMSSGGGFATDRQLDALGRVASVVAHELTNLLQIFASSLDRLNTADDPDGVSMRTVRASIERGTRLSRQLQTFAQTAPPRLQAREIHQLMAGWMPDFEQAIGPDRRLELRLRHSGTVLVDAEQLQTALVNLLLNARDATEPGSAIILELSRPEHNRLESARLESGRQDRASSAAGCRIAVIDHGEGMTDDVVRQAVAPFFTTRAPGKGMGLGLTIARMVAEAHGGSLDVDSAFGRGTTVSLHLVNADARAQNGETAQAGAGAGAGSAVPPASGPGAPAAVPSPAPPTAVPSGMPSTGITSTGLPPGGASPGSTSAGRPSVHVTGPVPVTSPSVSHIVPAVPAAPSYPGPASAGAPQSAGCVLVIDDEEAIAEYFRIILSAEHYDVQVVTSAHQALDRFAESPARYDTVLLDMMLRDGSGIDLYRKFRQLRPDLSVVVCTGFSDNESLAPIRADGHDILFKPCPRGDVLKAVARAVRRGARKSG